MKNSTIAANLIVRKRNFNIKNLEHNNATQTKWCIQCDQVKSYSCFGKNTGTFDNLTSWCSQCVRKIANKNRNRRKGLKSIFNIVNKPNATVTPIMTPKDLAEPVKLVPVPKDDLSIATKRIDVLEKNVQYLENAVNNLIDRMHRNEKGKK